MAEETATVETKEVPIGEVSMAEYKKARSEGKESVVREVSTTPTNSEKEEEKSKEERPKVRGGLQARIDRLIKNQATLEEQLAAEKKTREELQYKTDEKETKKAIVDPNAEPQRDQFNDEASYIRALTRWEVKQEMKAEREAEEREELAAQQKETISNYNKKAIEAQAKYEDWKEVMSQDTALPSIVGDAIVHTIKNGPDVAYYLGKHPEVCEEMLSVHPLEAVAMAVKISEQLASEDSSEEEDKSEEKRASEEEKPKKKAFEPIKPVTGGTTRSTIPLDKTSFKDYKKLRAQGRVQ